MPSALPDSQPAKTHHHQQVGRFVALAQSPKGGHCSAHQRLPRPRAFCGIPPRAKTSQAKAGFNAATSRTPLARWGAAPRVAFTMVELLATIAIIALLVAVIVPAVGNYVQMAKRTADKQTLAVLNDALTRYKTQGGDLTALTSGASIGNVLTALKTPVTWAGIGHKFLNTGATYAAADLGALGEGKRYRFTKYGDYADGSAVGSDILETVAAAGYDVGDEAAFDTWITDAMAATGTTNYLALTNPDTTQLFGIYARVASSGDKVRVWWGDGTTQNYDSITTASSSFIKKDYGSAADRTIVIVGDVSYIYSDNDADIGGDGATYFGGVISTMKTLTYFNCSGSSTFTGTLASLPRGLTTFSSVGNNTFSGDIADAPSGLTYFNCWGANTISGDIADAPSGLTSFNLGGNSSVSGNISNLPTSLNSFNCQGSNTVSGDIASLPPSLTYFNLGGSNSVTGSLANIPNSLTYINCGGSNSISYNTTSGGASWPSSMRYVAITSNASGIFTSAMVDAILIDLSSIASWSSSQAIILTGNCGARTSASDAAVATLEGNGVTVTTN